MYCFQWRFMAIEMQHLKTTEVLTFSNKCPRLQVTVPVKNGLFKARNVFDAVVSSLGLKEQSTDHFTLCDGLVHPKRRYVSDDDIPDTAKELSFQKWLFSSRRERDLMTSDDVAQHLIYVQAKYFIDSGLLYVPEDHEEELQGYCHPDFVLEKQYVELCQRFPGYYEYDFYKCVTTEDITLDDVQFSQGGTVHVRISRSHLQLSQGEIVFHFDWTSVQSWHLVPDKEVIKYTVAADDKLATFSLQTDRVMYMLAITKEIITRLQTADKSAPKFYSHMILTQEDGSTVWQNALFNYKKKQRLSE